MIMHWLGITKLMLAYKLGKYESAVKDYTKAISLDSNYWCFLS